MSASSALSDAPRRRTLDVFKLSADEQRIAALLYPERGFWRPRTRADCANVPRPCPFVGCRHHLYLDETAAGSLRFTTDLEVHQLPQSCSLDVAEQGPLSQEATGELLGGLSHERIRQIERIALAKLLGIAPNPDP